MVDPNANTYPPETDDTKAPKSDSKEPGVNPENLGPGAVDIAVTKDEKKERKAELEEGTLFIVANEKHYHGTIGPLRANVAYEVPTRWGEQMLRDFPKKFKKLSKSAAKKHEADRVKRIEAARKKQTKAMESPENK